MSYIQTLKLSHFRCYNTAKLENISPGLIVLCGPNGTGKTNILEAISILTPGRGLRGAKPIEIQNTQSSPPWATSAQVQTAFGPVQMGTGIDPKTEKRIVRINGQNEKSQNALGQYLSCVWLTPQMDRLFLDSSRERRNFLDRLIFAFDPGHTGRTTRYNNAMSQRSKLLREDINDPAWLNSLEKQMAETGVALAAARLEFTERLNNAMKQNIHSLFPQSSVSISGSVENMLKQSAALEVEDLFRYQLEQSRHKDAITGGAATGPHKSDLLVLYTAKSMNADQCSTGEQKALLIGLIMAHAKLIESERGAPPLLLLDEVAAHLDEERRSALYTLLSDLGGQVWLTGADDTLFESIKNRAQFFQIKDGQIL